MFDSPAEHLARNPSLRLLLEEYSAAQKERREREAKSDCAASPREPADRESPARETRLEAWVPRLRSMDGIARELLSQLHGRLIALGFVKFQLTTGSTLGLEYQVSPLGRRALGEALPLSADDQTADTWAESA
jgi:hypothetical protein